MAIERLHFPSGIDNTDVTDAAICRAFEVIKRLVHLGVDAGMGMGIWVWVWVGGMGVGMDMG